jgi:hypothetical protein
MQCPFLAIAIRPGYPQHATRRSVHARTPPRPIRSKADMIDGAV